MTKQTAARYPSVMDERRTLDLLYEGYSIARFGDGEFKLVLGSPKNVSQINSRELQNELFKVLKTKQRNLAIGIPDMNPTLPKAHIWRRYLQEYAELLDPDTIYCSAFISRPDSAPRIDTKEYYDRIEGLWRWQKVVLVGNGQRSLTRDFLLATGAKDVAFVECPYRDAYAEIDRIEQEVIACGLGRAILCGGAMATCLAARLCDKEIQAIDLGHIGMFWRNYAK